MNQTGNDRDWHVALDIGPGNSKVGSIGYGKVVFSGGSSDEANGQRIVIKHEMRNKDTGETITVYSGYMHLSKLCVKKDDNVAPGDTIGISSDHLHLCIMKESYSSDPVGYVDMTAFE